MLGMYGHGPWADTHSPLFRRTSRATSSRPVMYKITGMPDYLDCLFRIILNWLTVSTQTVYKNVLRLDKSALIVHIIAQYQTNL